MSRVLGSRKAIFLLLFLVGFILFFTFPSSRSQTPSVTIVSVGNEPRGLAIHPVTYKAVVTNHNSNTVTVVDVATRTTTNVTVGEHPYGVAIHPSNNRAYVANEGSDTVSVIDLATNTVNATLQVGGSPKEIAVNASTSTAVVANSKTDNVSILNLSNNTVSATISVGVDPEGVVINASNNRAFVTNRGSDTVSVINLTNQTVAATLTVGSAPSGMDINPGTQRIVVANQLSDTVTVINGSNNSIIATVPVGAGPADVAIHPVTNRAYVTNEYADSVSVIDLVSNTVIATYPVGRNPQGAAVVSQANLLLVVNAQGDMVYIIDLNNPPPGTAVPTGKDPKGVAIDRDTNTAVTANSKSNDLSVIDLSTASVIATLPVGKGPRDVAIHPTTKKLVSANYRDNTLSIIDLPTRTLLATVSVGKRPIAAAIDPVLNLAAVANERDGTLTLVDLATHTVSATIPAGSHPTDLDINPNTHIAVVANKKTDTVTVIDLSNRLTLATITVGKDPVSVAVNSETNQAVVANEKSNTLSIINLATNTVIATINVLLTPTGVAINPSTNIAAVVGHRTHTLMLVDLATNLVLTTFPAGSKPEQVAINPYTNVAVITNQQPDGVTIIQLPNPVPVLDSLDPIAITAGDPGFTLTLNGSKFIKTSTVNFGAQSYTPQFISNNQIRVDIPASAITQAGTVQVSVTNPSPGGGTSNSLSFTINNPVPSISTISPDSVTAGALSFTLTVNGANFVSTSSVSFNSQALSTTYVSATQLTAAVPASAVATAGIFSVTVFNPAPGGGTSNAATFTVNNPVPTTTSISPTAVLAGSGDTVLTVNGTNFVATSTVQFAGTPLTTTFVNSTQLTATTPASLLALAGTFSVTVVNPAPGGGTSNAQMFTVNNPVPTLSTLSPDSIQESSADFTLTLTGTNFVSTSSISFAGTALVSTFVTATQLTAQVPATLITAAGLYTVTVTNPTPGGETSNSLTFTVFNPVPSVSSLSPSVVVTGSGAFTLTVNGDNFVSTSSIYFDNQLLTTSFVSRTQLTAQVPASAITASHTAQVIVVNPAPGGGTSNSVALIVNIPPVADAGSNQSATVGKAISLDGRKSSDADADRITFTWSIVLAPAGSAATLANPASVRPSLTPDVAGNYQIQLIVNDGKANSAPATVTVTAAIPNAAPNAVAGLDLTAVVGQQVTLDGRKSGDSDDDRITYRWSMLSAPAGSTAPLSDASSVMAALTPDVAGEYQIQLVVNDGTADSTPAQVKIMAASPNAIPMARAGRDRNVLTGTAVTLDGSISRDPNGDVLTYRWSLISTPAGSAAALSSETAASPTFIPDLSGEYLVRLMVNDGTSDSAPDTILIVAAAPNPGPNAVAGADQIVYQTDTVTLDGTGSSDPNGDPITYRWLIVSTPTGSQATLSSTTAAQPTFIADLHGAYVARLMVSDGVNSSFADVVVVKTRALLSIAISPTNPSIILGQTQAFTASGTFADQTTKDLTQIVTWNSSDTAVATINASGLATSIRPGNTLISASYGSIASPTQTLTVINPAPTITSFAPTSGPIGTAVTITGTNFNTTTPSDNRVSFNGASAIITSVTATTLTTTVPLGATTGPIRITTSGGTATSAQPFTVTLSSDYQISVVPASVTAVQGQSATAIIQMTGSEGFSNLVDLAISGLPSGVTARFSAPVLSLHQSVTLTLTTSSTTPVSTSMITLTGTTTIDGKTITRTATVNLSVMAAGTTTFSGRVLRSQDELPLQGATIKLGSQQVTTDASGRYFFNNAPTGDQILTIDGSTVTSPPGVYHLVPLQVNIVANQANEQPFISYLPVVDTSVFSTIDPTKSSVIQDPRVPGFSLTIPAGVELRSDLDGSLITKVAITPVSPDRIPAPTPGPGLHIDPTTIYMLYFFKPGGAIPSTPITQFTMPNDLGSAPGRQMVFYHYVTGPLGAPGANQWRLAGTGKVSADGQYVLPDPGVGFTKFCCALTFVCNAAGATEKNPSGDGNTGADPIDLATGQFLLRKTDLVLPGRLPIVIDRSYQSGKVNLPGPFGRGTLFTYEIQAQDTESAQIITYSQANGRTDLLRLQPDGTFQNTQFPFLRGMVLTLHPDGSRTIRHKDGRIERYSNRGRLVGLEDRNGNAITIERNASDIITRIVDGSGRALTVSTNTGGRITQITDPLGRQVRYTYTANDLLETVTDPAGGITRYTYDAAGNLLTIADPRGIVFLTNEYDPKGRVIRQTLADGGVFTASYGTFGDTIVETRVTDPRGQTSVSRFNAQGYTDTQTDSLGQPIRKTLDQNNQVTEVRDSQNRVTRYTYDTAGNVTSIMDPLGNTTLFEYEPVYNRLTKLTDALVNITRFEYDVQGNLTKTTDPLGNSTTLAYNEFGQPISVTDPLGNPTRFEYDAAGNLVTTIDPLGNKTQRTYDAVSRLLSLTDPNGKTTRFTYDGLNRVTQITDAILGLTGFSYDPNGNLLTVTDAKNQTTTYTYDNMDRLATRRDPLNRQESYVYDVGGNLSRFTDRKSQVSTFTYDLLNRRIGVDYADGSRTAFIYDSLGRLSQVTDTTSGDIEFGYDVLDRLVEELTPQGVVQYGYDAIGRRNAMIVNGQSPVGYTYDANSRLTSVAQGTQTVSLGYDALGRRTSLSYPNGVTTSYAYDSASRLTGILHQGPTAVIESLTYTYDAAGNRISYTRNGTVTLLPAAVQAAYDAANEQIQFNSATPNLVYDANGNLTSQTDTIGTTAYVWDARNRLTTISGPGVSASFMYDALGRRVSKTINGSTTQYLYDGNDIIAEIGGGAVGVTYLRSLNIDEPFVRQSSSAEYYHTDALGSVLVLTDGTGTVQTTYSYNPFGNSTISGTSTNPFQYTGRENDGTGQYYYRARYYSPTLQRFISEDPIEFAGGNFNTYAYALNNPCSYVDPLGLDKTRKCVGKARVLKGNPDLIGKQGGFPGVKVAQGSAAIIPEQFGPSKLAVAPFIGKIRGVAGGKEHFSGVTDVIGGKSPTPGVNVRDALRARYPGVLIIELVNGRDLGITDIEIYVPSDLSCPEGTKEQ